MEKKRGRPKMLTSKRLDKVYGTRTTLEEHQTLIKAGAKHWARDVLLTYAETMLKKKT